MKIIKYLKDKIFTKKHQKYFIVKEKIDILQQEIKNIIELTRSNFYHIEIQKAYLYEEKKDKNKPSMLIISHMSFVGGMETRVIRHMLELKKYFNIFFVVPEYLNLYRNLYLIKDIFIYKIGRDNENLTTDFIKNIIIHHNIFIFEINIGAPGMLPDINFENIKNIPSLKLILILHGRLKEQVEIYGMDYSYVKNYADFTFTVSQLSNTVYKDTILFANSIRLYDDVFEQPTDNKNKILFVSRLDHDKMNSTDNLLKFAQKYQFSVTIAGTPSNSSTEEFKKWIEEQYKDLDIEYVGLISTQEYLKENYNQFSFVSGVGQVILEALSMGFPTAIASSIENKGLTFITNSNFLDCAYFNFSLIETSTTLDADLKELKNGNISYFNVKNLLEKYFDIEKNIKNYKDKYLSL